MKSTITTPVLHHTARGALILLLCSLLPVQAAAQVTTTGAVQISVGVGNSEPLYSNESANSFDPVAAPNADFVMFSTRARNFTHAEADPANPDQNGLEDIYKYSPATGLELMSVVPTTGRAPADGQFVYYGSRAPAISEVLPDGSYAFAFASDATDLVTDYQQTSLSGNQRQIYVRIPSLNQNVLISVGSGPTGAVGNVGAKEECSLPTIALLGTSPTRYLVAFTSTSSNLPPSSTAAGVQTRNIFLSTVTINNGVASASTVQKLVENPSSDLNYPALSGNGRYLVFQSQATIIPGVVSDNTQIYLYDVKLGTFELISRSQSGAPGDGNSDRPSISYQGNVITFRSRATDLGLANSGVVQIVYDRDTKTFRQLNTDSNGLPSNGSLTDWSRVHPNGRFVTFSDNGTNLVANTTTQVAQTFLKDLAKGTTLLLSATLSGEPGSGDSGADQQEVSRSAMLSIGATGFTSSSVFVTFSSAASNLASVGSPNFSNQFIFRSPVTLPGRELRAGGRIESPPDVRIVRILSRRKGARVRIDLTLFEVGEGSFATATATSAPATKIPVKYELEIRKIGSRDVTRRTLTRNRLTISRLDPGRYSVRYRATATKGRKTIRTGYSPKASLVVPSA